MLRLAKGEAFHVATALAGFVGSALAWALLAANASAGARFAVHFFGASLVLLFLLTALHHARPASEALRRLDHAAVYVAFAGSTAPVCLVAVGGPAGAAAFGVVCALMLAGVAYKLCVRSTSDLVSVWLYVPMAAPPLALLGALAYRGGLLIVALVVAALALVAAGAVVDAMGRPRFGRLGPHGAFHVASLAACALVVLCVATLTASYLG